MNSSSPVILGIDPGYDRIGWAIGQAVPPTVRIIDLGCLLTDRTETLAERYSSLENQLASLIVRYRPQQLAVETLFFAQNRTTALQVAEARGVIISCANRHQLTIFEYHPTAVKLAVSGDGRADKKAIEKMIRLQIKLPAQPLLDDAIDAVALVLTHVVTRK